MEMDNINYRMIDPIGNLRNDYILQRVEVEYTNLDGEKFCDAFEDSSTQEHLGFIEGKMSFIVECHLTDVKADYSKPITLRYLPIKQAT